MMSPMKIFLSRFLGSSRDTPPSRLRFLADKNEPLSPRTGAYFPLQFLTDMFEFINKNHASLNVFTYNQLNIIDGRDYATGYQKEYDSWQRKIAAHHELRNKAHLLIQYDIDSRVERSNALLENSAHDGIPANIMIFWKRVDRWRLQATGEVVTTEYAIDQALLRRRQGEGFVIGYHNNAYELAGHDASRALEIFNRDMTAMSEAYGTRFFSAHGGVPDAKGNNNNTMPYHPDWIDRAIWVHNGVNLRFDGAFSDGGHNSAKRNPENRDLRRFFETMQPGKRYRILLHPQYYGSDYGVSKRFAGTPWYDEMMHTIQENPGQSLWHNVKLRDI